MSTSELRRQTTLEARIELHRRLALPLACVALALVGIPLGISSRKGGKGSGYVTAIFLAFFCYHLSFISLVGLAKQGAIAPELAVWLPNLAFGLGGMVLIARLERPDDPDIPAAIRHLLASALARIKLHVFPSRGQRPLTLARLPLVPQIVDTYILSRFLFYFALLLATFVTMTEVYNFFELLSDIVRNRIPLAKVFTYLAFLTPKLIYDTLPISVLVAVLVTFGVLSKHNEVIAFKACGVSLTRLATPIFVASGVLSAGLFAFDHYYIPEANRKQDALRNEIKGRAVQTYLNPERKWIFGEGSRIYYYKHFDMENETMFGVMVFELDPDSFHLLRQTSAESAHWQHSLRTWIFENGWTRDFRPRRGPAYDAFQVRAFPELAEPPRYFLKEVKQDKQMNFRELERYIHDLQQSGFDTVKLRVQFYRKFSVPLFALIMALISVPFSFLIGSRGAMAGIGVSIGIAIGYWGLSLLFEQIGNFNQLPPAFAAWSPNALFALSGLYMMLRLRS